MDVLHRIRRLRRRIPDLRENMQKAREIATKTTATLDDMPHATSVQSKVENGVLAYEIALQEYNDAKEELRELKRFIDKRTLMPILNTDMQYKIVRARYHQNMRVKTIAKENGITERHAYRILNMAEKLIHEAKDTEDYADYIARIGESDIKVTKGEDNASNKT